MSGHRRLSVMPKRNIRTAMFALGIALVLVVAWVLAVAWAPPSIAYRRHISRVEEYIEQLEEYRRQHGVYPDERTQAIVPREEYGNPYFYEGGGGVYRIGFRVDFDERYFFESQSRGWSFEE